MYKKRCLDFVLRETKDYRYIFRFYPRQSSCHSFGDAPPKNYEEVYKVYFCYGIIHQYLEDGKVTDSYIIWKSGCDECSVLDQIAFICSRITKGIYDEVITYEDGIQHTFNYLDNEILPMGNGVSWKIKRELSWSYLDEKSRLLKKPKTYYIFEFTMKKEDGVSYITYLTIEQTKEFGEFLQTCCDYMLEHGDPI